MIWNSKKSTYMGRGKKSYKYGDPLPAGVLKDMGPETVKEYTEEGLLAEPVPTPEPETVPELKPVVEKPKRKRKR